MSARCCCRGGFTERRRATNRAPISHRIGEKPKSVEALSSEIGVKTDSWPPAGDGRPPMRSAGLMPKSNLGKKMLSAPLSDDVGDRGLCRLAVMESRQMRVAKPDPSASAIGDRGAASKLCRAAAARGRPPIIFHPRASIRRRPRCAPNRSENRPSQVMQAPQRALSGVPRRSMSARCCCRGGFTERRRATNRAPISHRIGEKVRPGGVIIYPGWRACSAADVSDWRSMFAYDISSAARRDGAGYSRLDWRR